MSEGRVPDKGLFHHNKIIAVYGSLRGFDKCLACIAPCANFRVAASHDIIVTMSAPARVRRDGK